MSYSVIYRPEAIEDVEATYDWYEAERLGLSQEFRAAPTDVERFLAETPEAFPVVYQALRRILPHRFP